MFTFHFSTFTYSLSLFFTFTFPLLPVYFDFFTFTFLFSFLATLLFTLVLFPFLFTQLFKLEHSCNQLFPSLAPSHWLFLPYHSHLNNFLFFWWKYELDWYLAKYSRNPMTQSARQKTCFRRLGPVGPKLALFGSNNAVL